MLEFFSKHVHLLRKKARETRARNFIEEVGVMGRRSIAADMSAIVSAQTPHSGVCGLPAALASLPTDKFTRRILRVPTKGTSTHRISIKG